tara:strand:+ start:147 stop:401 length:255 start_codon:yes stop_codon:yes gene_type:complete
MNPSEKSNSINNENENEIDQIKARNLNLGDEKNQKTLEEDKYVFGWSQYSEITNGRFAMIGFAAIILIEIISKKSFFDWAGIIN